MTHKTTTEFSAGLAAPQPRVLVSPAAHIAQNQARVYIVLLNWNGWQDTLECVRSLERMEYRNWHAVIVDNGSTDDSVARLKGACPDVTVVETDKNLGFAAGNNVGIRYALKNEADYVFVLNNDTTILPDTISAFVQFAEKHPTHQSSQSPTRVADTQKTGPANAALCFYSLETTHYTSPSDA